MQKGTSSMLQATHHMAILLRSLIVSKAVKVAEKEHWTQSNGFVILCNIFRSVAQSE
jgi:hypothetical protein